MKSVAWIRNAGCVALGAGLLIGMAGCASPQVSGPAGKVFFPPLPAEPRLQFLTSYSQEDDIHPRNRWLAFLVGRGGATRGIVKPYGLAFSRQRIYVCDTVQSCIDILDLERRTFFTFKPGGQGSLRTPVNMGVDSDGTFYVADSGRRQVLIYTPDGKCVGTLGTTPDMKPTDVLVTPDRVYVADLAGHRVCVYRKSDRQLLATIPNDQSGPEARLFQPVNLALDDQRRLYVSDAGAFCVKQYSEQGAFLRAFGSHGDAPGQFARPRGVAVDRAGRLFVVDAAAQVIQVFGPEGELLLFFGEPGASDASLNLPAKVVIDYYHVDLFRKYAAPDFELEYLVLVTNQYGDRKVSVYGFGHRK